MKRQRPHARLAAAAAAAVAVGALAAVFAAYRHPGLVVDLAARLWSCF